MKRTELNDGKSGMVNVALTRLRAFSVKMPFLLLKISLGCSVVLPVRFVTSKNGRINLTRFFIYGGMQNVSRDPPIGSVKVYETLIEYYGGFIVRLWPWHIDTGL